MRLFLRPLILFYVLIFCVLASYNKAFSAQIKRDPFVPLIDSTGRIKPESELRRSAEVLLPLNISLKGIIWSPKDPLAIINNKIFREGAMIFEGLTLEKINSDHIILNDRGEKIKIYLRKKEKK